MVYPVCKAPPGRVVNVVGEDNGIAGDWNRENAQCTTVAEDNEAQWQDVRAGGGGWSPLGPHLLG